MPAINGDKVHSIVSVFRVSEVAAREFPPNTTYSPERELGNLIRNSFSHPFGVIFDMSTQEIFKLNVILFFMLYEMR